jgi:hypothetical protein
VKSLCFTTFFAGTGSSIKFYNQISFSFFSFKDDDSDSDLDHEIPDVPVSPQPQPGTSRYAGLPMTAGNIEVKIKFFIPVD